MVDVGYLCLFCLWLKFHSLMEKRVRCDLLSRVASQAEKRITRRIYSVQSSRVELHSTHRYLPRTRTYVPTRKNIIYFDGMVATQSANR